MVQIQDIFGLAIVGVALTTGIQALKNKFGGDSTRTKLITVAAAILLGAGYWALRDTDILVNFLGILGTASTIYALFVNKTSLQATDGQ